MKQTAISIIGKKKCTGCAGCSNVCKFGAIIMSLNKEGFYNPQIDESRCTECGVCIKKCPVIQFTNPNTEQPMGYAGWSKNEAIRLTSSSGGIFTEIALEIIRQGGVVFGVKWNNGVVEYGWTDQESRLAEFRSSKYIQAQVGEAYKQVKIFLDQGRWVLFAGLGCQIAALRRIISSDKLVLVDLACLGVPSVKLYQKYVSERFGDNTITHTQFRSKTTGWRSYSLEFWENNKLIKNELHLQNKLFYGFSPLVLTVNKACYDCKFAAIPRCGDITLADYWGAQGIWDDPKGVSAILLNNAKGRQVFEQLDIFCEEKPLSEILRGNPRLYKTIHIREPRNRARFFKNIDRLSFQELSQRYIVPPSGWEILWKKIKYKLRKMTKG